jgi:hypothetical protein
VTISGQRDFWRFLEVFGGFGVIPNLWGAAFQVCEGGSFQFVGCSIPSCESGSFQIYGCSVPSCEDVSFQFCGCSIPSCELEGDSNFVVCRFQVARVSGVFCELACTALGSPVSNLAGSHNNKWFSPSLPATIIPIWTCTEQLDV